jgi:bifunctional DNase/RNase
MVEMVMFGVSFDMIGKQPIVLLKTVAGNRFLPIWIGHAEAASILMQLQGSRPPRPSTHDLLVAMVEELGGSVGDIAITSLEENTFFAEITINTPGGEVRLDARPSDAIATGVRVDSRIWAAEDVLEESGVEFEQEPAAGSEEMLEEFRSFLEDVNPEDFLQGDN